MSDSNWVYNKIATDDTYMETLAHGSKAFPFAFYDETMDMFDFQTVDWHWHTELEFVLVESGSIHCRFGQKQFNVEAGEGLFGNSKVLHQFVSSNAAKVPNFLFSPAFIAAEDSLIFERCVKPVIHSSVEHLIFSRDVPWQAEALRCMKQIVEENRKPERNELAVSILVQSLWLLIYKNIKPDRSETPSPHTLLSTARLQVMLQFIHENYTRSLSLDDIAAQVPISKSTALSLFKTQLDTTPVDYLIRCRLKNAALLLTGTEKRIGTISDETGFENVGYFCRIFKKRYGMTPSEYRKKKAGK